MNPLSTLFAQLEAQVVTPTPKPSVAEHQQRLMQNGTGLAPHTLLVRVANLLGVPKGYLLEHGFIEPCDLEEQAHADPRAIAALIRTSPRWSERPAHRSSEKRTNTPDSEGLQGNGCGSFVTVRHSAPVEWIEARDAYLNHLAACPACWAPIKCYCPEGRTLHQHYQSQPKEPRHD